MLLAHFIRESISSLEALYPPREARSLILRLCEDRLGVSSWTHIVEPETVVEPSKEPLLSSDLSRLLHAEPLQYVLGWSEFCGRRFKVSPGVLIPRPETEQLAGMAVEYARSQPSGVKVLDLCTGSGCIAWTVFLDVPGAEVTATDISDAALGVASGQFAASGPVFLHSDVLKENAPGGPYDIILSNPPYIRDSERSGMRRNVLDHEPSLALFVPDADPLRFYRAVARICGKSLKRDGLGLVEINESLGVQTADVFSSEGLSDVRIIDDLFGKNRFVSFTGNADSDV